MDRAEVMALEAGRDFDALIAEKVMDWRWIRDMLVPPDDDLRLNWAAEWDEKGRPNYLPFYSNGLIAAGEVIERMEAGEYWMKLSNVIPNSDPVVYECVFEGRLGSFYACEDTIPLAICRSALLIYCDPNPKEPV